MDYYNEIKSLIKKYEINKKARILEENSETLKTNWTIGKLIVEAQGGKTRAKYGNELIKEWAKALSKLYGSGYDSSNLKRFRSFFLTFPKIGTLCQQLTWSHIKTILPIKDENKRNYYINLCIKERLSKRELISRIKNYSYERLLEKPEKIELITTESPQEYHLLDGLKNPIIIKLNEHENPKTEEELQITLLAHLKNVFNELGQGFAYIGNEYKIKDGNKTYKIDLLLFNTELNSYVVVELKIKELKPKDKGQIEFYMHLVDKYLKRSFHNETKRTIIPLEYELKR